MNGPTTETSIEHKRAQLPMTDLTEDGQFSGYASLFGVVDLGRDRIMPGAFRASLEKRGIAGIRMLFQHDPASPIGVWEVVREDARGLFVKGRILPDTEKGREVLSLLRAGAVDGLSIGFKTQASHTDRKSGIRSISRVDLWEISVVTFPMLPDARVAQIKGGELPSIRQFERWLTQDAGLSRGQARTIIGKGFAHLVHKQDAVADPERLVATIRKATRTLSDMETQ